MNVLDLQRHSTLFPNTQLGTWGLPNLLLTHQLSFFCYPTAGFSNFGSATNHMEPGNVSFLRKQAI